MILLLKTIVSRIIMILSYQVEIEIMNEWIDLPSLSELRIGYHSFEQVSNVTLHSLPLLMEASIDERGVQTSFSSITKAIITHEHPIYLHNNITQIILPSNQYNSLTYLHMSGFPSLQLLQFGSSSLYWLSDLIIESIMNWIWLDWIDLPSLDRMSIEENGLYCRGYDANMTMKGMIEMIE